jgi:hypothetical protein
MDEKWSTQEFREVRVSEATKPLLEFPHRPTITKSNKVASIICTWELCLNTSCRAPLNSET